MPKLKTHKGASKRFKKTGTGKVVRNHAFARHILTSKSRKRKRKLHKQRVGGCRRPARVEAHDPVLGQPACGRSAWHVPDPPQIDNRQQGDKTCLE